MKHTSNFEDSVDLDKFKRIIPDSRTLRDMNEAGFQEWKEKLFHTNLSFFDKAIEKAKTGKKENTFEAMYLNEIDKTVNNLTKQVEVMSDELQFYQAFFSCIDPECLNREL